MCGGFVPSNSPDSTALFSSFLPPRKINFYTFQILCQAEFYYYRIIVYATTNQSINDYCIGINGPARPLPESHPAPHHSSPKAKQVYHHSLPLPIRHDCIMEIDRYRGVGDLPGCEWERSPMARVGDERTCREDRDVLGGPHTDHGAMSAQVVQSARNGCLEACSAPSGRSAT